MTKTKIHRGEIYERVFSTDGRKIEKAQLVWQWRGIPTNLIKMDRKQIDHITLILRRKPGIWYGIHSSVWMNEIDKIESQYLRDKLIKESAINRILKVNQATDRFLVNMPANFPNCHLSNAIRRELLDIKGLFGLRE